MFLSTSKFLNIRLSVDELGASTRQTDRRMHGWTAAIDNAAYLERRIITGEKSDNKMSQERRGNGNAVSGQSQCGASIRVLAERERERETH